MAIDISQQADDVPADLEEDEVSAGLERFRDWAHSERYPEFGKFSYIQGALEAEMSPESLHEHNFVKSCLNTEIGQLVKLTKRGQVFADRTMFVNESAGLATEPDLMFASWETFRSSQVSLRPYKGSKEGLVEVHGTPDLIVEIVSPSSTKKDKVRLKKVYFECGVPEYWLIDARGKNMDFSLFVLGEKSYTPLQANADGYFFSSVLDQEVRFDRTPNEFVRFEYQLLFRPKSQA